MPIQPSVVIPLYNKAAYIGRTIDSVLAQTHVNFEVIVVNDGSTDGGPEIVNGYRDSRVRLINQENRGLSGARNRGVAESRAEWIAFLDADDEWLSTFLEETLAAAKAHPSASVVFANVRDAATTSTRFPTRTEAGVVPDYLRFHIANDWAGICPSAVIIRRQALLSIGGFPEQARYGEDIDCWVRLAWTENQMVCIPEVLALYHGEAAGRHSHNRGNYFSSMDQVISTCRQWMQGGRVPARLAESTTCFLHTALSHRSYLLMDGGDNRAARRVLWTECSPTHAGWGRWLRHYVRAWVPPAMRGGYRRLKVAFRRAT